MSWKKCFTKPARGVGGKPQKQGSGTCCPTTSWCMSAVVVAHSRLGEGRGCGPCNFDNTNDGCVTFDSGGLNQALPASTSVSVSYGLFGICPGSVVVTLPMTDTGGVFTVIYDDAIDVIVWACVASSQVSGLIPPTCTVTPPATLAVGCSSDYVITAVTCP